MEEKEKKETRNKLNKCLPNIKTPVELEIEEKALEEFTKIARDAFAKERDKLLKKWGWKEINMSLNKKQREWLSQQIVNDTKENLYDSEEFMLDCVREVTSKWNDEKLLAQFDINIDDLEAVEEFLENI